MNDPNKFDAANPPNDARKKLSRRISNNMAPEAILDRLQTMSDLSRFCHELGQAKRIGKVSELQSNQATTVDAAYRKVD